MTRPLPHPARLPARGLPLVLAVAAALAVAGCERPAMVQGYQAKPGETVNQAQPYRILVARPYGPVHREAAENLAREIGQAKGTVMIDGKMVTVAIDPAKISVVHDADQEQSFIYYGKYNGWLVTDAQGRSRPEFDPAAKADLQMIKQLKIRDPERNTVLPLCPDAFLEPLSQPDPPINPEWLLANAPPEAAYALQIGFYHSSPDRKQAAVDAVKKLRAEGIAAFVYHGPSRSLVCVGAFGPDAVVSQGENRKPRWSQEVLDYVNRAGDAFKYNLDNGQIWYKRIADQTTGRVTRVPQLSFLVKIPRNEADTRLMREDGMGPQP